MADDLRLKELIEQAATSLMPGEMIVIESHTGKVSVSKTTRGAIPEIGVRV